MLRVIFDADGSLIENKVTGERIALKRKDRTFMVVMQVGPQEVEDDAGTNPAGFYPAGSHHSIGTVAGCNRKTDDTVGVCAGAVELDDADMEIEMEARMRRPDRKAAPEEPTAQEREEHTRVSRGAHGLFVHGRGDGWQDVGDPRCERPVVEGVDVNCRPPEAHGRVRLQACRSLHEGELACEMSMETLKTDNEPALVAVTDAVAKVRASRGAQPGFGLPPELGMGPLFG